MVVRGRGRSRRRERLFFVLRDFVVVSSRLRGVGDGSVERAEVVVVCEVVVVGGVVVPVE